MPHVITQSCCATGPVSTRARSTHPPVAGRARLRDRRDALHRSGVVRRLRRVRVGVPGRCDRARHQARCEPAAVRRPQRAVPCRAVRTYPTSKLAPDHADHPRDRVRSRGDRRFRAGRHVRRRRAADPARRARQRVREAADAVRSGARGRRARSQDHQVGRHAVRPDRRSARLHFFLNVEVGRHVSHADLLEHHHAVLYAVGAPNDRRLDIEERTCREPTPRPSWWPGSTAIPNAHRPVDLSGERVVIIGNGNVALDVARILTTDPRHLAAPTSPITRWPRCEPARCARS